jgi:branched-chain amino acid transport system ATP-binding protein
VAILEVSGISMAFGGNRVLNEVSLDVHEGMVTGLIGPNGAGKTTLFNIISGLLDPSGGRVVLGDRDVTRAGPAARARKGLSRTYQQL